MCVFRWIQVIYGTHAFLFHIDRASLKKAKQILNSECYLKFSKRPQMCVCTPVFKCWYFKSVPNVILIQDSIAEWFATHTCVCVRHCVALVSRLLHKQSRPFNHSSRCRASQTLVIAISESFLLAQILCFCFFFLSGAFRLYLTLHIFSLSVSLSEIWLQNWESPRHIYLSLKG